VITAIPSPDQGVWYVGPLPVRAYSRAIIIGVVVAIRLGDARWKARGVLRDWSRTWRALSCSSGRCPMCACPRYGTRDALPGLFSGRPMLRTDRSRHVRPAERLRTADTDEIPVVEEMPSAR
jgi:hypothetical protein